VRRLLTDTGYPDVAAEFARRHGLGVPRRDAPSLLRWHERRVRTVLGRNAAFGNAPADDLCRAVLDRLEALGFREVSDSLIVSLAEHCLVTLARSQRAAPAGESVWLRPSSFWEPFFSGETAALLSSGVLFIHPVSALFPVVRLTLDLPRLAERCRPADGSPLSEQILLPAVEAVCARIVAAIPIVHQTVLSRPPQKNTHPTHVQVAGFQALMRNGFGRIRRIRRAEIETALRERLTAAFRAPPFRIVFSLLS